MISRKTPLRRGGPLKRKTRMKVRSDRLARLDLEYARARAAHLAEHPLCQIAIFRAGLSESDVLAEASRAGFDARFSYGIILRCGRLIRTATEIHHRNKRTGPRRADRRWFMSACQDEHEWVEKNKGKARELGLLLPIQADSEGHWGDGYKALTTDELMKIASR